MTPKTRKKLVRSWGRFSRAFEASPAFDAEVEHDPNEGTDPEALYLMGRSLIAEGRYRRALQLAGLNHEPLSSGQLWEYPINIPEVQ